MTFDLCGEGQPGVDPGTGMEAGALAGSCAEQCCLTGPGMGSLSAVRAASLRCDTRPGYPHLRGCAAQDKGQTLQSIYLSSIYLFIY